MEKKTLRRISFGAAIAAVSYFALDKAIDYDNDVNPSVGIVTKHAEPEYECHWTGKFNSCGWEYWLYINGCVELSPEVIAEAKRKDSSYEPSRGWVEVSRNTWSNNQDGDLIQFRERNFINSIVLFGADNDHSVPCE